MPPSVTRLPDPAATSPAVRSAHSTWVRDLTVLGLACGLWFCGLLGMRPLANPDEGRYTEIPREMAASGDFVTPRLNGVKYFEKPPLVYWLSALTFRQFGVNEFTARLWGGLFSLGGVLITYVAARAMYGRGAGIGAAIALSTTLFYYAMSQIMLLDMAVAVTMSGAMFAFILAMREPRGRRRLWLFLACYAFMALATLAKGLIGIAIPGAVMFLWVVLLNRWRALWPFYPLVGGALLLAIAVPWHICAARANADFLDFYFIHEHWLRFTTRIHDRYQPWWFFLPILLLGLFPWIFFIWRAVRESLAGGWKARQANSEAWFLVIWVVFIMVFFSKSQSKLIPYILPVFPAIAVLCGRSLAAVWQGRPGDNFRAGGWAFIGSAVVLLGAIISLPVLLIDKLAEQPDLAECVPTLQLTMGGTLLIGAVVVFISLRGQQPRLMLGAITAATAGFLLVMTLGAGSFDKSSTKRLAIMLKPILQTSDRVYSVGFYAQDLPAYLGRLVSVVDYRGELEFGIDAEPELTAARFLAREQFPAQWAQAGAAYAVISKDTYTEWFARSGIAHEVIAETPRLVLAAKPRDPSQH